MRGPYIENQNLRPFEIYPYTKLVSIVPADVIRMKFLPFNGKNLYFSGI